MKWSPKLRTLRRGIRLATRIVKARIDRPAARPASPDAEIPAQSSIDSSRLVEFNGFGDNPGRLRMRAYLPPRTAGNPLVVLLHGCGQDAAVFAQDSGWIALADRLHIPLILPEQAEANNAGRCFQWFQPAETARDHGEAGSIAEMVRAATIRLGSDPHRIFVVGLSAGGAMAAALLAAYPDLFAAGAAVAGLPVGSARSGIQAMLRMAAACPDQSPEASAASARANAPAGFTGPWPRLSVWQGEADTTVAPENATLLATQWCTLQGLTMEESDEQLRHGVRHRMWPGDTDRRVELWSLPHLPHGYPVGTRVVTPGHFVEQAPVDATAEIARFFGLD